MKTPRYRIGRRACAALAVLASTALTAGCWNLAGSGSVSSSPASSGASASSEGTESSGTDSQDSDPQGSDSQDSSDSATSSQEDSSATAWTTIGSAVAQASTGATTADILAANTEVADVTTEQDDAGTYDASSATTISLSGTSATVDGEGASAEGSTVTITAGGTYVVSGEATDGQLVVNAPDAEVRLVLDGANVTSTTGAAVNVQDAGEAVIVLAQGSTNTLADAPTYADTSADAPTAALFSSDTLTITGTGSLDVTGSYNDGISSKNGLVVTGDTTITVTAADDGVRGKDYLVVESGTLTVTAGGDGLKSSEDDDETKGFVALGKADVTLTAEDDGITAHTDVTVAGTTVSITAGGGQANAVIEEEEVPGQDQADPSEQSTEESAEDTGSSSSSPKGITAGVSYTQDSGTVTVDAAHEGVEAAFINVGDGSLHIASGDDGINASSGDVVIEGYEAAETDTEADDGSVLTVSGGEVQVSYASSDGIDSNGSAYVTGGIVLVSGQAGTMDGAIDVNGASQLVGLTGSPSVTRGDTLTVTEAAADSAGEEVASLEVTFTAEAVTVIGLTEGQEYTVASTSGGSATGTAAELSSGMGGPGEGTAQGQAPQGGAVPPGGNTGTPQDAATAQQAATSQG
ncbi:carbohydrate-binding domain-containing protein [Actinomyces wuliandei]|uniref:carbohydrate-binding domain-containing protein n=1 Tax=Actinomyces wuliandei TaxID=2057743 RepID=UPI001FA96F12|nr:carbohydrate-binding domain-containing protein [Actinomyces wuliandei]